MAMTTLRQITGGRRLAAPVIAVFAVLCVPGAVTPAVLASTSVVPIWTKQAPASSPPVRYGEAMAYDAATGTVVLFGGDDRFESPLGDTWTWDGSAWTKQAPTSSPPARVFAAMAYDAATGTVVLFGGHGINGQFDDTWTWNGSTWAQQHPATHPAPRFGGTMAYDAAPRTIVLFGGANRHGDFGDTWTWDGFTWTQQAPAASPPARYGQTLAYDASTGTVVLFGGLGSAGVTRPLGDTWTWGGSTWTQQAPASHPTGRYDAESAYDPATGNVVLFGGLGNKGVLGDTWIWG